MSSYSVHNRAAQTGVYSFLDVSGFKASFFRKRLTDIDRRPVRNSDNLVKNACLSGPNVRVNSRLCRFDEVAPNLRISIETTCMLFWRARRLLPDLEK
jgi:hypothetical protein